MRLLVTINYVSVLFAADCDYAQVIKALETATVVEQSGESIGRYGERAYVPATSADIDIKLLPDGDIRLPGTERPADLDKLLEVGKQRDDLQRKVYSLEAELTKIRNLVGSESV